MKFCVDIDSRFGCNDESVQVANRLYQNGYKPDNLPSLVEFRTNSEEEAEELASRFNQAMGEELEAIPGYRPDVDHEACFVVAIELTGLPL